jgi:hypothetical protein
MNAAARIVLVALLVVVAALPSSAQTIDDASAWRLLAEKLDPGTAVDLRLRDGHHFKATFIAARGDVLVVQRKTRIPVPVEAVQYESVASLARVSDTGMSAGKVTAIALGSAGAAIGVFFLVLLASLD